MFVFCLQELKVDENSVFTAPNPNTPTPGPDFSAGTPGGAGSNFSPYFGGSNPSEGFDGSGSAGPSSMAEGYGLEPGQMIEEGSKGRETFCRFGHVSGWFLGCARAAALAKMNY